MQHDTSDHAESTKIKKEELATRPAGATPRMPSPRAINYSK